MRTPLRLLAVLAAGSALLTACGEEEGTRESLIESLANPPGDQPGFSRDVATCIADGLYERFSGEEIEAIDGAESDELSTAARDAVQELASTCTDGG